jgi:hypothetical protein
MPRSFDLLILARGFFKLFLRGRIHMFYPKLYKQMRLLYVIGCLGMNNLPLEVW